MIASIQRTELRIRVKCKWKTGHICNFTDLRNNVSIGSAPECWVSLRSFFAFNNERKRNEAILIKLERFRRILYLFLSFMRNKIFVKSVYGPSICCLSAFFWVGKHTRRLSNKNSHILGATVLVFFSGAVQLLTVYSTWISCYRLA